MFLSKYIEMLAIGVPEISIVLMFGLILGHGNKFYKRERFLILKLLISVAAILSVIIIARSKMTSIMNMGIISLCLYTSTYKLIFDFNIRKSLILGSMSAFFIITTEIIFMPVIITFHQLSLFQMTVGTRILQFIILLFMNHFNLTIGNLEILKTPWELLPKKEKIYLIVIIFLIFLISIFNIGYSDLMMSLKCINVKSIGLILYFIQNILYAVIVIYLLIRTRNYQIYREFLGKTREEMFIELITCASDEEITIFEKIIEEIKEMEEENGEINT